MGGVPNPRTRYGMIAGLAALAVGFPLIILGRMVAIEVTVAGALFAGLGIILGNISAIIDAYFLRRHDMGWTVSTTIIMVFLLGPIWVAYVLSRRDAYRGVERSFAERMGRAVGSIRSSE